MIYISLLLDTVSIILGFIIINFLYNTYIDSKGSDKMEENNIEQIENTEPLDDIIYADPPEEVDATETIEEKMLEEIDEAETIEEEQIEESTITITNDNERIFTHSSFHDTDTLKLEGESTVSKRRRLALKLSAMNSNNK